MQVGDPALTLARDKMHGVLQACLSGRDQGQDLGANLQQPQCSLAHKTEQHFPLPTTLSPKAAHHQMRRAH